VTAISFVPNAWCRLCKLPSDNNEESMAKFKVGDLYQINAGVSSRNLEEEEPGFLSKLAWHTWISVTSSADKCIYSFGLTGANDGKLRVITPDLVVDTCYTRLSACIWNTSHGKDYELGREVKNRLRVSKSRNYGTPTNECRFVCLGMDDFHESGVNKDYPIFESWRSGKLNKDQVAILRWLIRNTTTVSTNGSLAAAVPFRYSLICSLPGAQTLDALRPDMNVLDVANCQTFAANFDKYSAELLRQLKAYKF